MSHLFPPPQPSPLSRLSTEDGLLLNAERWQCAHEYHRQRQNLHYQSINQPGIVCGLGVSVISAPDNIPAQYRDERWIVIQSGIAIDLIGNPIVVAKPIEFRIASEAKDRPLLVYIVISYVDPEKLHRQQMQYILEETFRIDEKTSPPSQLEVELCRILLLPGQVKLAAAANVFSPLANQIDLCHRQTAMPRPRGTVKVSIVLENSPDDGKHLSRFSDLIQSIPGLYPAMQGVEEIGELSLEVDRQQLFDYDLIFLNYQKFIDLTESELETLKTYHDWGGLILVEFANNHSQIVEQSTVRSQMQIMLENLPETFETTVMRQKIQAEIEAIANTLDQQMERVHSRFKQSATKIVNIDAEPGTITQHHPLRKKPFLFGRFPIVAGQEIQIFNWEGIVLIVGDLSIAWGLEQLKLPRETIRTSQEMGINILQFAWQRRQLIELQKIGS